MEKGFFERHSDRFLEMAFSTDRQERIRRPDGYGKGTKECGDTVEIFISLSGETLEFVSYQVDGCVYANACAAALSHLATGKLSREAADIKARNIIDFLETLPDTESHCAELVADAFHKALGDMEKRNKIRGRGLDISSGSGESDK